VRLSPFVATRSTRVLGTLARRTGGRPVFSIEALLTLFEVPCLFRVRIFLTRVAVFPSRPPVAAAAVPIALAGAAAIPWT
jgi:hypothetical protein